MQSNQMIGEYDWRQAVEIDSSETSSGNFLYADKEYFEKLFHHLRKQPG